MAVSFDILFSPLALFVVLSEELAGVNCLLEARCYIEHGCITPSFSAVLVVFCETTDHLHFWDGCNVAIPSSQRVTSTLASCLCQSKLAKVADIFAVDAVAVGPDECLLVSSSVLVLHIEVSGCRGILHDAHNTAWMTIRAENRNRVEDRAGT